MKRRFHFLIFLGLIMSCGACAKYPAPAVQNADGQAAFAVPDSHEASVDLLFKTMKMRVVYERAIPIALEEQIKINPQLAQLRDVMEAFFIKYMGWGAIQSEFKKLYMEAFTKEEVDAMIAFYRTPVGQKAAELTPELMAKGGALGREMVTRHLPELQQMIAEKMKQIAK